ncbi:uncharacterized protein LOC135153564 [Lytechinus pictus]|uniref:uncharacterized protein LOC135153564 n=1 Tax=Lytechinus pictus TaxID=7653 RepID=UPI0030BA01A9
MNDHDALYCWIGLTLDDNGTAVWMDGSSLTYQNTDHNSHDQGLECLRISKYEEYTWQDTDCSIRYQYTCEKEIECSTTAGSTEPVTTASTTQLPNTQTSIRPSTTTLAATITAATTSATRRESSTATGSTEPVTAASTSQPLDTQTSLRPTTTTLAATITATTTSVTRRGDLTSSWYELIAQNERIKEWNIIERHTASTVIRCADLCSTTESCSCFTFIADDVDCLLGEYDPRDGYMNNHPGATTFVTI